MGCTLCCAPAMAYYSKVLVTFLVSQILLVLVLSKPQGYYWNDRTGQWLKRAKVSLLPHQTELSDDFRDDIDRLGNCLQGRIYNGITRDYTRQIMFKLAISNDAQRASLVNTLLWHSYLKEEDFYRCNKEVHDFWPGRQLTQNEDLQWRSIKKGWQELIEQLRLKHAKIPYSYMLDNSWF